jgi:hypothetical protein
VIKYGYQCERHHMIWEDGEHIPGMELSCPKCGEPMTLLYMVSEYQRQGKDRN